jgi:hypothetical protein
MGLIFAKTDIMKNSLAFFGLIIHILLPVSIYNYMAVCYSPYTMSLQAQLTLYQNEVRCRVNENDFNYTQNPSATISGSNGQYIDAVTGSDFRPYATSIGLYNDQNELLIVGKLSTPYPIPSNTDMTFVVKWDS